MHSHLMYVEVKSELPLGVIRHNKKDGAVSIRETIFCEFWSIATTVKKIFDKPCNFIDIDTSFA